MPKTIKRITHGFVVQTYDTKQHRWVSQEFVAGDEVEWEDGNGDPVDDPEESPAYDDYLPFEMKQP